MPSDWKGAFSRRLQRQASERGRRMAKARWTKDHARRAAQLSRNTPPHCRDRLRTCGARSRDLHLGLDRRGTSATERGTISPCLCWPIVMARAARLEMTKCERAQSRLPRAKAFEQPSCLQPRSGLSQRGIQFHRKSSCAERATQTGDWSGRGCASSVLCGLQDRMTEAEYKVYLKAWKKYEKWTKKQRIREERKTLRYIGLVPLCNRP